MTPPAGRSRIIRASEHFTIDRHRLPSFPLVVDGDGALIEPLFDFLRAEAVQRHLTVGTLVDEAYALGPWWDFAHAGNSDSLITVDLVVRWTGDELEKLRLGSKTSKTIRRISRCLDVITRFHEHLLRGWDYSPGDQAWRASRYLARLDPRLADRDFSRVTFSYSAKAKGGGRPTPSEDEVELVLNKLADTSNSYIAARDWLMARWMRDVGLRRAGVASLTVEALRVSLAEEGVLSKQEFLTRQGTTLRSRGEVRVAIERLRATGRTFVAGRITEKGNKTREIKIPFPLLHQTLDFIWSERAGVAGSSKLIHGDLWLSLKTGRGLKPTTVGDIMKFAFVEAGVRGSGHRLRACFAEEVVFRLYSLAKDSGGVLFDENQVLIDTAEELGHSDWRSLRSYLNRAARNYTALNRAHSGQITSILGVTDQSS